ncbi:MAG: uracil-DNA glycosylase family protein [Myxococcales bacterium]|nr:uracil-DNA glycosylase family protein [Myxococcales bacterium]
MSLAATRRALSVVHRELDACRACPKMSGPPVHCGAVASKVLLVGQAPGPREGKLGRPFAWTAGKTLFKWFEAGLGVDEETFRARVYMAAVARCFPGKAKGGGDRKPDPNEIARCRRFLESEVDALEPELVVPVGALAIQQVLVPEGGKVANELKLADVVGEKLPAVYHGRRVDVIALPHPSGASTWHRTERGRALLERALSALARHPAMKAALRGA